MKTAEELRKQFIADTGMAAHKSPWAYAKWMEEYTQQPAVSEPTESDWNEWEEEAKQRFEGFVAAVPGDIELEDAYISGYKMGSSNQFIKSIKPQPAVSEEKINDLIQPHAITLEHGEKAARDIFDLLQSFNVQGEAKEYDCDSCKFYPCSGHKHSIRINQCGDYEPFLPPQEKGEKP